MMPHPMPVELLEETRETEPSDGFVDLLNGVGLEKAQEFFRTRKLRDGARPVRQPS